MAKETKVQIKSNLDSTLRHNGLVIEAGEVVSVDESIAKVLVEKKFCSLIKVKAI